MNLLYTTSSEGKQPIVTMIQRLSQEPLAIAQNESELIELARTHRPGVVLMFMPAEAAAAVEIQYYIREFLPHARVRILPAIKGTKLLLPAWEKVVAKAFRRRMTQRNNEKGLS